MYCLKCKRKTESNDVHYAMLKNNKHVLKGTCVHCGCKKCQFTGGKIDIHSLIGKLPRPKNGFTLLNTSIQRALQST